MVCTKCGNECRIAPEQIGVDQNNMPIFHRFAYCDTCKAKWDIDLPQNYQSPPVTPQKKNSALSVWACVLAIFTCTLPIAFILGLVDLGMNDKSKKHTGSWFAVIWSVVIGFFLIVGIGSSGEKDSTKVVTNENVNKPAIEVPVGDDSINNGTDDETSQENEYEFSYGNCTVKYLKHEIMKNDYNETVLVVYYDFTNNDTDTHNFDYLVSDKAFQNGVELDSSWWHANDETKNSGKEIQKGTTLTVANSYVLNESRDNVTIEFRPFNVWSDKLLMSLELELE